MILSLRYMRGYKSRQLNNFYLGHLHHCVLLRPSLHHVFVKTSRICRAQIRGKGTKSSMRLDDLPGGILSLEPLSLDGVALAPAPKRTRKKKSDSSLSIEDLPADIISLEPLIVQEAEGDVLPKKTRKRRTKSALSSDEIPEDAVSSDSLVLEGAAPRTRSKKTKSVKLDELPQGLIPLEPLPMEEKIPTLPTVMAQARSNMLKFENCVLLTRVGGFYELYFEHADEYGPLLNLKVADKAIQPKGTVVSMAGFPFFQLDRYLKILVQDLNRYVAIAEEFPNDASEKIKAGGLMHDRRVSRIITPGTLIDENFIDPFSNNYILAIHIEQPGQDISTPAEQQLSPLGLAWLDLSTGHFFTQSTTLPNLPSILARISPSEIVLDEDLQASKYHGIFTILNEDRHLINYTSPCETKLITDWAPMLESPLSVVAAKEFTPEEIVAGSSLLKYVETRVLGSNMKLQPPTRQLDMMGIDKNTMRALEIKKTMRDDVVTGSLLHTVRQTVTKGGARLLDSWLSSPSTSLAVINSRLDLVTHMLNYPLLRERTTTLLKRSHDAHRLLQKFAFGRGDPDDLLDLAATIFATEDLAQMLQTDSSNTNSPCITALTSRVSLTGPSALAKLITDAIDEDGIVQQHRLAEDEAVEMQALALSIVSVSGTQDDLRSLPKGARRRKGQPTGIRDAYLIPDDAWIMRPGASLPLTRLHTSLADHMKEKLTLEKNLATQLGADTLTLRFTPGMGHICHLRGRDISLPISTLSPEARTISTSKSTRCFHHPSWSTLGQSIDQIKQSIRSAETALFQSLRETAIHNIIALRRNASVLAELDVACSFASLASERKWVRPILNTGTEHKIIGGRHPTVEGSLEIAGRTFVSNDLFVSGKPSPTPNPNTISSNNTSIYLITGPNMAGKSTFLRQNALITILAQTGSYVPCSYASLGIVDAIFSRVGSADNLYADQSTFMVEMLETAQILRRATERSFVIMDEVGRGTSPGDGEAVAYACLWWLHERCGCRVLFATHFYGLADKVEEEGLGRVGFWCTDVQEDRDGEGGFRYVHKLREGVNRRSHALKVARLAGLPEGVIDVARRVMGGNVKDP